MKLGIFDSGIGGEAVASALAMEFPQATIMTVNDRQHLPYGDKTASQLIELTNAAIAPLLYAKCDLIVIACNSATTAAIDWLRKNYPNQKFIGIEPMIKPAAKLTKTKIIAVCATPATLSSKNYARLINQHAKELTVIEPDCSLWASLIEQNQISKADIENVISDCLERGADVIVLGCTHYHWIKQQIEQLCQNQAIVLEPSEAIGRRVRSLLDL